MALVNSQIKQAKLRDADYKMADGEGMYLLVNRLPIQLLIVSHRTIVIAVYASISYL